MALSTSDAYDLRATAQVFLDALQKSTATALVKIVTKPGRVENAYYGWNYVSLRRKGKSGDLDLQVWINRRPAPNDARKLWFGLYSGDYEYIEGIKTMLHDGPFKVVPWTTDRPNTMQPIFEEIHKNELYIGLYETPHEPIEEYCRRCMKFVAKICEILQGPDAELAHDLAEIIMTEKRVTEREQLINARLGQGSYRAGVLKEWSGSCAVTGCTVLGAIRASHIKPWKDSDSKERLSPENGLPLIATLDALFDAGLITFDVQGSVQFSSELTSSQRGELEQAGIAVNCKLRWPPKGKQIAYLEYHRQYRFRPRAKARQ